MSIASTETLTFSQPQIDHLGIEYIHDITMEITHIGPADASRILAEQGMNRSWRKERVRRMAADMAADAWTFDGAPIRFDDHGKLYDGQHRLRAVVKSGIGQYFVVVRNVPAAARVSTDSGASRTIADHFKICGVKRAAIKAAAVSLLYRFMAGKLYIGGVAPSVSQADELLDENAARLEFKPHNVPVIGAAIPTFFNVITADDDFERFWHTVNYSSHGPGLTLYEWAMRFRKPGVRSASSIGKIVAVASAWNAFYTGSDLRRIQVHSRTGGMRTPMIAGLLTRFDAAGQENSLV